MVDHHESERKLESIAEDIVIFDIGEGIGVVSSYEKNGDENDEREESAQEA